MVETIYSCAFSSSSEEKLMRRDYSNHKNGTTTVKVVCAVCFWLFSFVWLYAFQADVLAVSQHILSDGATHYNRSLGAIFTTLALYLLQLVVSLILRQSKRSYALTYLPSMLFLALISDFNFDDHLDYSLGDWKWLIPLVLLLWGACVWLSKQLLTFENQNNVNNAYFSRDVWQNVLILLVMVLFVTFSTNTNAVFHFQAHAETSLLHGDDDEALHVGAKSLETNASLTMLRAFALSRKGEMGEHLFEYALEGKSTDLLPLKDSQSRLLLLPADSIYKHLGGRPKRPIDVWQYLNAVERDSFATRAVADYVLCGFLMDKNLKAFAHALPRYYEISDSVSLPRHYQEAMVMYRSIQGDTVIARQDSLVYDEWVAIRDLKKQIPDKSARRLRALERHRGSYFYYYLYK